MYSSLWSPRLRQGDILGPAFLPTIGKNFETIGRDSSFTSEIAEQPHSKVILPGGYYYLAVISHCCEFNEGKRNKFLVARLMDVPGNLDEEQREALRLSNHVERRLEEKEEVAGVDGFLLEPLAGKFESEQVVAFTSITAYPMGMKDGLQGVKVAELEHEARVQFREKLAWFVGRASEDIPDDEKTAPPPQEQPAEGEAQQG